MSHNLDYIDVIVTSTCRRTIYPTIKSFEKNVCFSGTYNFIINVDVLNKNKISIIIRFLKRINVENVNINFGDSNVGHAKAINYLFSKISSPLFFHLEEDWVFLRKVNLDPLIQLMCNTPEVDHIRFSKRTIREKSWLYYKVGTPEGDKMLPKQNVSIGGINLVKTHTWSFNPCLCRTPVVKKFLNIPEDVNPEFYVCEKYYEKLSKDGCYIYGKIGDRALVKDIGRKRSWNYLRKLKKMLMTINNRLKFVSGGGDAL